VGHTYCECMLKDNTLSIEKLESDIWGLSYIPKMIDYDNDADQLFGDFVINHNNIPCHFSNCNIKTLEYIIDSTNPTGILEIGVHRPTGTLDSSTKIILDKKSDSTTYIGIDKDPKDILDNSGNNVYSLSQDSNNHQLVYDFMETIGVTGFDLIMIDGWHSVNMCVSDWKYTERLLENGVVILHDTNFHPGPMLLFDAIDGALFDKKLYCINDNDYGLGVLRRK